MSKLEQINLMLRKSVYMTVAHLRDILILPLDTLVLVTTTILLKIFQKVFLCFIGVYKDVDTALREAEEIARCIWNVCIKLFVVLLDDFFIVSRAEFGYVGIQEII